MSLSKQEAVEIKKCVARAAASPEVQSLFAEDIKNATTNVANTLENFKNVLGKLLVIDNKNILKDSEKFAPKWQVLYDDFYNILDKSKSLANQISAVGTRFMGSMNNVIRITTLDPAIRARIVISTGESTKGFEDRAKEIERDLDTLDKGLSNMKALLDPTNFAAAEEAEYNTEMADIVADIAKIQEKLGGWEERMKKLSKKLGIEPVASGISSGIIRRSGTSVLKTVVNLLGGSSREKMETELEEIQNNLEDLETAQLRKKGIQTSLDDIAQARIDLADVCERIGTIRDALKFFKGFWAEIRSDTEKIAIWLSSPDFQDEDIMAIPEVFDALSGDAKQYYKFLNDACHEYATGLGNYTK